MNRGSAPDSHYSLGNLLNILELACGADQILLCAPLYISAAQLHVLLAE